MSSRFWDEWPAEMETAPRAGPFFLTNIIRLYTLAVTLSSTLAMSSLLNAIGAE